MTKTILILSAIFPSLLPNQIDALTYVDLTYRAEFGTPCPGVRAVSKVHCETDGDEERLVVFEDGKAIVLAEGNRYHPVLEAIEAEGENRFSPISGTLWIEGADEIVPPKQDISSFSAAAYSGVDRPLDDPNAKFFKLNALSTHLANNFSGAEPAGNYRIFWDTQHAGARQQDLSCYKTSSGASESNCELAAGYGVMKYLINDSPRHASTFSAFPKKGQTRSYYPQTEEPDTYNKAMGKGYTCPVNPKKFEIAYITMRQEALAIDSGHVLGGGLIPGNQSQMLERFAHHYGLSSFDAYEVTNYNAETGGSRFYDFIHGDVPLMFGTTVGQHGAHVIAVFGYQNFKRYKKNIFGGTKEEWRTILEVHDGGEYCCFDITQYHGLFGSFGCFIEYIW